MKKALLVCCLVIISVIVKSQEADTIVNARKPGRFDTTRIADLSDKLSVYFNILGKINSVDISGKNTDKQLNFAPNGRTSIGFGLDYKWIGVGISFSPASMNKDDQIYGNTEKLDFQINYYGSSFGIDAYIKRYKGFYLSNPEDFIEWTNPNYPLLPGLETNSIGLSGYYFFNNKRFSYKAAYSHTQLQKKSAGSLILGVFANINVTFAPNGVLPEELPDSLFNQFDINGFSSGRIGVSTGYAYTLVIRKRFYANLSLVPGFAYAKSEISSSLENFKSNQGVSASFTSRFSFGYEGKNLYAGFNLVAISDSFKFENIDISSSTGNLKFYVGKRFDISKLFKKNK